MPISHELYTILCMWREQAISDDPPVGVRRFGLCHFERVASRVYFGNDKHTYTELRDLLQSEFLDVDYPFHYGSHRGFGRDSALQRHHLNINRLTWVSNKIEEYERSQK